MDWIILDTSSIIFSLSNHFDPFAYVRDNMPTYRILISSGVVTELGKLGSGRKKEKKYANVALALLGRYDLSIAKSPLPVDRWIVKEAISRHCLVCTNDIKLKESLRDKGVNTVSVARNGSLR